MITGSLIQSKVKVHRTWYVAYLPYAEEETTMSSVPSLWYLVSKQSHYKLSPHLQLRSSDSFSTSKLEHRIQPTDCWRLSFYLQVVLLHALYLNAREVMDSQSEFTGSLTKNTELLQEDAHNRTVSHATPVFALFFKLPRELRDQIWLLSMPEPKVFLTALI